jgi:drug/metabolite transporter (DMT)-like permease
MVIMQKPLLSRFPALSLVFWSFVFGGVINICIALGFVHQIDWVHIPLVAWFGVAYIIVFGTVGAWLCNAYANQHLPSSITGMHLISILF